MSNADTSLVESQPRAAPTPPMRVNFTKAGLEGVPTPPTGTRRTYHDTRVAGLHLIVTDRGVKTFYVRRKLLDRSERVRLGRFPELSVEQARAKALQTLSIFATGGNPAAVRRQLRGELNLGELYDEYEKRHLKAKGKKSVAALRDCFELYLGDLKAGQRAQHGRERAKPSAAVNWSQRKLSTISRADVEKLHERLGDEVGGTTANRVVELLRAIYNKAIRWELYDGKNPAAGIDPFASHSRDRFLQSNELPAFLSAVQDCPDEDVRDFIMLALLTGARRNNVLAMRWDEVNLDEGTWRMGQTKNGQPHRVPLCPEAVEILERRAGSKPNDFVFPGPGKVGHMTHPKRRWELIRKAAGVDDVRFHDLRRTFGSWQAATGASWPVIGQALGHRDVKSTAIYARLSLDPVRVSIERATSAILQAARRSADGKADEAVRALEPAAS